MSDWAYPSNGYSTFLRLRTSTHLRNIGKKIDMLVLFNL